MVNKLAKKKKIEKILILKGELLEIVVLYNTLNEQKKDAEDDMKPIKKQIIEILNKVNMTKGKSQIYTLNLSHIEQEKLSEKKLKEELFALEDQKIKEIWKRCLYKIKYDRLTVKKRKGGENIF